MRICLTGQDRRARLLVAAWTALFLVNAAISAPLCKQLRSSTPFIVSSGEHAASALAGSAHRHSGGQSLPAAPNGATPSRHHGNSAPSGSDGDCEFCLLTGIASTALPLEPAPPRVAAFQAVSAPALSPRFSESPLPPIRAPPAA